MTELEKIGKALESLAFQHKELGKGGAADPHGAIEWLAMKIEEGSERIAHGLNNIAAAIRKREYDEMIGDHDPDLTEDQDCYICDRPCHLGDMNKYLDNMVCDDCWDVSKNQPKGSRCNICELSYLQRSMTLHKGELLCKECLADEIAKT